MRPTPPIKSTRYIERLCPPALPARKGPFGAHLAALFGARVAGLAAALRAVSLLAVLAAWSGCAHIADVKSTDPGFTALSLRTGGLAILGVVKVNEIPQVRPPLIEALERVLVATRGDIPLTHATRVQASMDDSTTRFLLLGYQFHGTPEPNWLARAADSLGGVARYGLLARVESDVLRYSNRDAPYGDPALQSASARIKVTGRDTRISVSVYDLPTRALVFSGKFSGSRESAAPDTMPMPPVQVVGGGVSIGAAPREAPDAQGYPEPPPLARAVESAFLEFARTLPGSLP